MLRVLSFPYHWGVHAKVSKCFIYHQSTHPSIHTSLSIHPPIGLSIHSLIHPSIHPPIYPLSHYPPIQEIFTKQVLSLREATDQMPTFLLLLPWWTPSHKEIAQHNVTNTTWADFSKKLPEGLQFRFRFQPHLPPCELEIKMHSLIPS